MTRPNFLIVGAEKAGTSSVHHYLSQHPDVFMSSFKEPGFFAMFGETKFDARGPGDQDVFRQRVSRPEDYEALFREASGQNAVGESSTIYLYHPEAPERIRRHLPGVRIIAILRQPVERAYAHHLMMVRFGRERLTNFRQALLAEERRIRENWGMGWHYARKGFYAEQIKRYLETFGPERLRVYLYDDLCRDAVGLARDIFRFLEIDDSFTPDVSRRLNRTAPPWACRLEGFLRKRRLNAGPLEKFSRSLEKRDYRPPAPPPGVKKELKGVFKADILQLEKLIQRDLSAWLK